MDLARGTGEGYELNGLWDTPGPTITFTDPRKGSPSIMKESPTLVVYEKPTCTTCRKMVKLLKERGIGFERLDYFIDPLSRAKLKELLKKMGIGPRDLLRTREPKYRELGLKDPALSDEALLDAMVEHPELIQRPILERGDRAVLGRPVERVLEMV